MTFAAGPFRVLFVCTGNICRSPIAEQLFRSRLSLPGAVYSSAGTAAITGDEMPAEAVRTLINLGIEPSPHSAQRLNKTLLEHADLVVALTREHRSEVVRTLPRANRFTFTLLELARLLEDLAAEPGAISLGEANAEPSDRLRSLVPLVASRRGHTQPSMPDDDDVADPYGQSASVYELVGTRIDDAVRRIEIVKSNLEVESMTS